MTERAPFVVFSLPRSRSAWLSVLLSSPDRIVGHDIGAECREPAEFVTRLQSELAGTCETGAAFAWRLIRTLLPHARFAVILRDPAEVIASLEQRGLWGQGEEMWRRWSQLQGIAKQPDVLTCTFDGLRHEHECAALYRHCLDEEMPSPWWRQMDPLNVQVDLPRQISALQQNHAQIEALKSLAVERMASA